MSDDPQYRFSSFANYDDSLNLTRERNVDLRGAHNQVFGSNSGKSPFKDLPESVQLWLQGLARADLTDDVEITWDEHGFDIHYPTG